MFDLVRLRALEAPPDPEGPDTRLSRAQRRARGAYFTPVALAELVVELTLEPLLAGLEPGRVPELCVLDPACGDGRFLAAAGRFLARRLGLDADGAAELRRRCLVGIERDPDFAEAADAQVPGARIHRAEALLEPPCLPRIDAVVGNPPYLRSIHLGRVDAAFHEALRGRYSATSHGEWDLYTAFLEQSFEWIRGRGQVGLVVPSRWLSARSAAVLRAKLGAARSLRGVIDFGTARIFADATTYASVVLLSGTPATRAWVARLREGQWSEGSVDTGGLGRGPWNLSVGARARACRALERGKRRLGELAVIAKGAGTNCDPVFVFEGERGQETTSVHSRALGRRVEIESEILVPCVRGRDIRGPGESPRSALAIVPYDHRGHLYSPAHLRQDFPLAATYLEVCRARLDAREGGRFAGEHFYGFGRPQNLELLLSPRPRVLVPDVARGGRALASPLFALDSAYSVFPKQDVPVELLAQVLASTLVLDWLRERGVLLRGGYVRMKTAYLADLPVPDLDEVDAGIASGLEPADAVSRAYGVGR